MSSVPTDPYATGTANPLRNTPRILEEAIVFRYLQGLMLNRPIVMAYGATCSRLPNGTTPMILSHFAQEPHQYIRAGSDWTSAGILDAKDFSAVAGIPGTLLSWRATILIDPMIEQRDDAVRRVQTKHPPAEEFDFPFKVAPPALVWSPTGW
jgi:hypothetical protein